MMSPSTRFVLVPLGTLFALVVACPATQEKKTESDSRDASAASTQPSTEAPIELPPGDGPVATVNGVNIPRDPFNKEYTLTIERYQRARHDVQPALRERLKDNIVRRLVDAELIRQQAEKMQVTIAPPEMEEQWATHKKRYGSDDAFKAFLERAGTSAEDIRQQFESNLLREKVFAKVNETVDATAAEVKDFFEKNQTRYDEPEQIQASHILIRIPQNATPEDKAAKKKRAEEARKKVKAKGADFATLAAEFGEDPTKDRGGDLGLFAKGRMVKAFEDVAWAMKVGQISDVVETQFGFHVIKKTDHKPARKKPFSEVEEQIKKSLQAKKRNESIRDALAKWKSEAKIELFVKGDEKLMAAERPTLPTGQPAMVQKEPGSSLLQESGGMKIERLSRPSTEDKAAMPTPSPETHP